MPTISEILKSKIGKHGVSKSYVASEMGVSDKTIENYMNGKRQPKPAALALLAKILKFELNELSEQTVRTEPKIDSKAISSPMAGSHLEMIINDNHELIEANKRLIIAHETIARTNERLAENLTASVHSETMQVVRATLDGLREFVIDGLMRRKDFHSREEALAAFRKRRDEFLPKIEQGGIRGDSDKVSRKK